jgi:hypothetical protein
VPNKYSLIEVGKCSREDTGIGKIEKKGFSESFCTEIIEKNYSYQEESHDLKWNTMNRQRKCHSGIIGEFESKYISKK